MKHPMVGESIEDSAGAVDALADLHEDADSSQSVD